MSSIHLIILSSCHPVLFSSVRLIDYKFVSLSIYQFVNLLACKLVSCSACASWSLRACFLWNCHFYWTLPLYLSNLCYWFFYFLAFCEMWMYIYYTQGLMFPVRIRIQQIFRAFYQIFARTATTENVGEKKSQYFFRKDSRMSDRIGVGYWEKIPIMTDLK